MLACKLTKAGVPSYRRAKQLPLLVITVTAHTAAADHAVI
jgi:hypothetical protein